MAATEPVNPIAYRSPVGDAVAAGQYLAGTNTQGSSTSVQKGDVAGLQAILSQILDPNNLQSLVESLFQQGAAQVPGLTSQFANATGTRTTNNSMLGQSLASLNQSLAQAIANAVVQQQQVGVNAAKGISEANRSTSNQSKQDTKPGSLGRALGTGAVVLGGGKLINAGNKWLDKTFPGETTTAATEPYVPGYTPPDPYVGDFASGPVDTTPVVAGIDSYPVGLDYGVGAPIADMGVSDAISMDALAGGDSAVDAGSAVVDTGNVEDYLGGFFADGGTVKPLPQRSATRRPVVIDGGTGRPVGVSGYADGGTVRNRANFGTVAPITIQRAATAPLVRRPAPVPIQQGVGDTAGGQGATAEGPTGPTGSAPSVSLADVALTAMSLALAGVPAAAMAVPAAFSLGTKSIVNAAVADSRDKADPDIDTSMNAFNDSVAAGVGPASAAFASSGDFSSAFGATAADFGGTGDAGYGDGSGGYGGAGDSSGAGDSGSAGGDSGGGNGGGEADGGTIRKRSGYKDGGAIRAKEGVINTKSASNIDNITIKATEDEYMLPVDVVNFIGKDHLDELVGLIHMPIGAGTKE